VIEHFIHFIVQHNETVIQWLVLAVVLLAAVIVGLSIFRPARQMDLESEEITEVLKKVATGAVNVSAGAGAGVGGGAAAVPNEEVQRFKQELEAKAKEVATLKLEMDAAKSADQDLKGYQEKIKELEGKLAEYEILEDDIADLSLFKEENVRLKAELKQLAGEAGAGGSPPVKTTGPGPVEVPSEVQVGDPKDDLIKEFQQAVESQKAPGVVAEHEVAAKGDGGSEESGSDSSADDLLSEFAASIGSSTDLDADKMIAEVEDLKAVDAASGSALEEDADIDKMVEEATKLKGGGP